MASSKVSKPKEKGMKSIKDTNKENRILYLSGKERLHSQKLDILPELIHSNAPRDSDLNLDQPSPL